jgi:hypothetical protein
MPAPGALGRASIFPGCNFSSLDCDVSELRYQLFPAEPLFGSLSNVFLIQMLGRLAPSVGD